jgi:hypothetical protein
MTDKTIYDPGYLIADTNHMRMLADANVQKREAHAKETSRPLTREKIAERGVAVPGASLASLGIICAGGMAGRGLAQGAFAALAQHDIATAALHMAWALARSPHRTRVCEVLDMVGSAEGLVALIGEMAQACDATGEDLDAVIARDMGRYIDHRMAHFWTVKKGELVNDRRDLIIEAYAAWPDAARERAMGAMMDAAINGGFRGGHDRRFEDFVAHVTPCGLLVNGPRNHVIEIGAAGFQARASALGLKSGKRGPEALVPGWCVILDAGEVSGRLDRDAVQMDGGICGLHALTARHGAAALDGEACLLGVDHEVRITVSGWCWLAGQGALLAPDWMVAGKAYLGLINLFREDGWAYGARQVSVVVPEYLGRAEAQRQGERVHEAARRAGRGDLDVRAVLVGPDSARLSRSLSAARTYDEVPKHEVNL